MTSPKTVAFNLGVQMRAEATRKAAAEALAKTHPSKPRTSPRWIGRNKGAPFSRHLLKKSLMGPPGQPALLKLDHPTRGGTKTLHATPALLAVFFPSLPENLAAAMLGH